MVRVWEVSVYGLSSSLCTALVFRNRKPGRVFSQIAKLKSEISEQSEMLRKKMKKPHPNDDFEYPFSFYTNDQSGKVRGLCNWVIPGHLMVGQYPGRSPENNAPSQEEIENHFQSIMMENASVSLFCCLQSEIPDQSNDAVWNKDPYFGEIKLPLHLQTKFPNAFSHYAPIAQNIYGNQEKTLKFLHAPIEDLNVPKSNVQFLELMLSLLKAMNEEERTIYIHCWGGRGRTGLVSACLLSCIWPELLADTILDIVQIAYSSRLGAENMPVGLSKSPQTKEQINFVREFISSHSAHS